MSGTDYIAVLGGLLVLALALGGIWGAVKNRREAGAQKGKPRDKTRYPP